MSRWSSSNAGQVHLLVDWWQVGAQITNFTVNLTNFTVNFIWFSNFSCCYRAIGGLLSLCSSYCYVMEDDVGICGYVCASPSYRSYMEEYVKNWIPKMKKKYTEPRKTSNLTPGKVSHPVMIASVQLLSSRGHCSNTLQLLSYMLWWHWKVFIHLRQQEDSISSTGRHILLKKDV